MAQLSDDDRADLVAYLDGELEESAAQALEARLTVDTQLRTEADSLKRTWELLDHLPRPEPSASFTNRTLERLAVKESASRSGKQIKRRSWVGVAAWAAAVLVALGVGRLGGQWLLPAHQTPVRDSAEVEEQMAKHLWILENRHLYDNVEDLDFLRALDTPDLFGEDSDS